MADRMHSARLQKSPRLQRVHELLADGNEHSTRDILRDAHVCAVNSCISELRANGAEIEHRQIVAEDGQRYFLYRMTRPVPRAPWPPPMQSIPPMSTAVVANDNTPPQRQHALPLNPGVAGDAPGKPGAGSGITPSRYDYPPDHSPGHDWPDDDYICDVCGRAGGEPLSVCGCGLAYCDECGDAERCERCA